MSEKLAINTNEILLLLDQNYTMQEIAKHFKCNVRTIQRRIADDEILKENVRLAKQKQAQLDKNRIANKSFREYARLENAISEILFEFNKILQKHEFPKESFKQKSLKTNLKATGLLHITDTHFNELIDLPFNKYDFNVASKRLKKFITDAKVFFKARNITNICVCLTGDLINSDRRFDEKLSQATNRAKALFLSVSLLEQALVDLSKDFNVSVITVIGNESRIPEDIGWVEEVASDNYDYIIHHVLERIFKNSNITFLNGSTTEQVIELSKQNVLIAHGNQIKRNNRETAIQSIVGKWARNGVKIDFVISGHDHCTRIGDNDARGASLAGANAYSNDALQLSSRAAQNIHIFYDNGNRDSIKIDLQNYSSDGYVITKELEAYNAKSLSKAKKKTTIHKIVI